MTWEKIWKNNSYYLEPYPTNNVLYFYKYHLINKKKKIKILDNGCGDGRNFEFLRKKGFDVFGTDISSIRIKKNKKKFNKYKKKFFNGDIRKLDFPDNFFDVILSEASLYYQSIEDIRGTVDKFYSLLKKGGIIRVYTKSIHDNFFKKFDKRKSKQIKIKNNHWEKDLILSFLTIKDVKKIFNKFNNVQIGIDEFNFINMKKKHSFFIITATK